MKRILLASICVLAFGGPARAQLPVTDALGDAWHAIEGSQLIQQVAQAVKTVTQLQQMYRTEQQQLGAITGMVNVSSWVPSLNTGFMQNPLPSQSSVLGLLGGNGMSGNSLSGLANSFLGQNKYYLPPQQTGDWNATFLQKQANTLAGFQATITQLFDSSSTRLTSLDQLKGELDQQPDLQHLAALQGRISAEQSYAQVQQSQVEQVMALAQAQQRAEAQQQDQRDRESADQWLNSTQALP